MSGAYGVDLAPSALEKAQTALSTYPNAQVSRLDMVNETVNEMYDAALDVMGLHMLVTDGDRKAYLRNALQCLKPGAPMLFFRESYRQDMAAIEVQTYADWLTITGDDYTTPQPRHVQQNGADIKVSIPLVPARAKSKDGYIHELTTAGFAVESFLEMDMNSQISYSASLFTRKPN